MYKCIYYGELKSTSILPLFLQWVCKNVLVLIVKLCTVTYVTRELQPCKDLCMKS